MRKFGPRLWLSFIVVCWGVVTLGTTWAKSYGDYCVLRILLGVFEAGLFQGKCQYIRQISQILTLNIRMFLYVVMLVCEGGIANSVCVVV